MQNKLVGLVFLALLFIQGCIPSLHPLYTAKELVLHKSLDNKTYQSDKSEWQFKEVAGKKSYQLQYLEDDIAAQFEVHLIKLGDHLFLDFFPKKEATASLNPQKVKLQSSAKNAFFDMHLMPVHSFAKVEFEEDQIIIRQFDGDWLDKLFRERRIRIKHEITAQGIVLTASTKELQKFILKYAEEEKAYNDPIL